LQDLLSGLEAPVRNGEYECFDLFIGDLRGIGLACFTVFFG
jgi:hypothetical protein